MKLFVLSVATLLFTLSGFTQNFHVTTTGDDGGSGSESDPWESIQHAMDNATAGSTVYIHAGTYNERVYVNVSGEENAYITFTHFQNDEVIIDGSGLTDDCLVEIYNVHHIAIEGLKIRNNVQIDAIGVLIEGACDHIRIKDCELSNIHFSEDPNAEITEFTNAQALIVYGTEADHSISSLEITGNEIYNCRLGYSEGLALNGNVSNFQVTGNVLHDLTNIGIDIIGHEGTCSAPEQDQARAGVLRANRVYNCISPYATAAGIYVDGGKNIIIERNHVYNNQWGIEIGCENVGKSSENIVVRSNFIYENTHSGLALGGYDYPDGSGKVENVEIVNNSFYGNDTAEDWNGELFLTYCENAVVANNILYSTNENGVMMYDNDNLPNSINRSFFFNQWYHPNGEGNIEWYYQGDNYTSIAELESLADFGSGSSYTDPLYVSVSGDVDLHLTASSPAINSGTPFVQYGMEDIDGEIRFLENLDAGADEYGSTVGIASEQHLELTIYPNPASNHVLIETGKLIGSVRIKDQFGRCIPVQNTGKFIDLSHLESGVYFLEVQLQNGPLLIQRLIKE